MNAPRTITARFQVTSWQEDIVTNIGGGTTEINGVKYPERGFSRADVGYRYSGDLDGTSTCSYLISYRPGAAPISGFEYFEGTLDGHDGSLVFQHSGEHDAEGVRAHLTIVEGLGTGGLETISGEATVDLAGHSDDGYPITVTYRL